MANLAPTSTNSATAIAVSQLPRSAAPPPLDAAALRRVVPWCQHRRCCRRPLCTHHVHRDAQSIYPELKGKLNGHAVRIPLMYASLTDLTFELARPTTAEEVNGMLQAAAAAGGALEGVMGFETKVSSSSSSSSSGGGLPPTLTLQHPAPLEEVCAHASNQT
jgi:hypothetical protein